MEGLQDRRLPTGPSTLADSPARYSRNHNAFQNTKIPKTRPAAGPRLFENMGSTAYTTEGQDRGSTSRPKSQPQTSTTATRQGTAKATEARPGKTVARKPKQIGASSLPGREESSDELNLLSSGSPISGRTRQNRNSKAPSNVELETDSDSSGGSDWIQHLDAGIGKGKNVRPGRGQTTGSSRSKASKEQAKSSPVRKKNLVTGTKKGTDNKSNSMATVRTTRNKSRRGVTDHPMKESPDFSQSAQSSSQTSDGDIYTRTRTKPNCNGNKTGRNGSGQCSKRTAEQANRPTDDEVPKPAPFPMGKENRRPSGKVLDISTTDESASDELDNKNDDILARGGPRPFPMCSSQDCIPRSSKPPSSSSVVTTSSKRESEVEEGSNKSKRQRTSISFLESQFMDAEVNPDSLCPYCDMPFPEEPSPYLRRMLANISNSYSDPRPTNSKGRNAPLLSYINMCQRHRFEVESLPTAKAAGWPTRIDFDNLPSRITKLRPELRKILKRKEQSTIWREMRTELANDGLRKVTSIAGQFGSFDRCQPGYYGEQGSVIMYHTLCNMFPPEELPREAIAPLTPSDFLQRVLLPECALALIQEDMGQNTTLKDALRTMRDSSKYGAGMFPDLDSSGVSKTASGQSRSRGHNVGENVLKARVKEKRAIAEAEARELNDNEPTNAKSKGLREPKVRTVNAKGKVSPRTQKDDFSDDSDSDSQIFTVKGTSYRVLPDRIAGPSSSIEKMGRKDKGGEIDSAHRGTTRRNHAGPSSLKARPKRKKLADSEPIEISDDDDGGKKRDQDSSWLLSSQEDS